MKALLLLKSQSQGRQMQVEQVKESQLPGFLFQEMLIQRRMKVLQRLRQVQSHQFQKGPLLVLGRSQAHR